jgi:glycerophosphoryl diester phosphodiesterase
MVPKLSAHRGGPEARHPPNSLAAIEAACELGVDLVEFDVRVTAAGQFVIGHDERARDDPAAVSLAEVLDVIKGRAMGHVDLKDATGDVAIADLCTAVLGADGFVITTGIDASVRRLRDARPLLVVGLSLGRHAITLGRWHIPLPMPSEVFPWRRLRRSGANLVAVDYRLARLGVLTGARRRGLPVLIWTLNRAPAIRAAQRDERLWAYTTDYPRLAIELATT